MKVFSFQMLQDFFLCHLRSIEPKEKSHLFLSWFVLISGLLLWTSVQSYLVLGPLWNRVLPPEVDDSLAYLVRAQVLAECPERDCPALKDLLEELAVQYKDPDAKRQRRIASFPFPFYHPLFSLILLSARFFVTDLITAYKVVWSLAPALFGIAFACLLVSLWGRFTAGLALGLLAFKIFPESGLQYLTPSNLAMAISSLLWARIISKNGDSPWTLVLGSLILISIHPLGYILAVMSTVLAFSICGSRPRRRIWVSIWITVSLIILILVIVSMLKGFFVFNPLGYINELPGFIEITKTYLSNATEVLVRIVRIKEGLFGAFPFFFLTVGFGFIVAKRPRRKILFRVIVIYVSFLLITLGHSHPLTDEGALFMRMWIPLVVILFGSVGNTIRYLLVEIMNLLKKSFTEREKRDGFSIKHMWPALALLFTFGYCLNLMFSGSEQIIAIRNHMKNRQALDFEADQPNILLSQAEPEDKVLYSSTMIMAYYFIRGAMQLGAIYYHPELKWTGRNRKLLYSTNIRYAVTYNPNVYHPSLEGLDENDRCITSPEFHFSPLSKPRKYGPISREGFIPASDFRWIQVEAAKNVRRQPIRVFIRNPSKRSAIEIVPLANNFKPLWKFKVTKSVPAQWRGWISLEFNETIPIQRFRIILPKGNPGFLIGGITFGEDKTRWPWSQKADLIFFAKDPYTGTITLSFDPKKILPKPLKRKKITVLDDRGSSVLFRIDPK